ncbi:MAG: M48 family metalloprotease [Abditibacteriales bacterium]|nr:M48 family metalloprotease [Abditibacteriales bacterium]MDW8366151.1 M48 family metalloprotease [Abditibacteriales bacterium]
MHGKGIRKRSLFIALLNVIVIGFSVGHAAIFRISPAQEVKMGQSLAQEVFRNFIIFKEDSDRLARIGRRLLGAGPWPKEFARSYSFWVVRDPKNPDMINAFCAPGGFICFYKTLYDELDKRYGEAAIAAVMAHEIEHAARHHVAREMGKTIDLHLLITILTRKSSESVKDLGSLFVRFQNLQFSREHENESDEWGLVRLWRAGYPATAMSQPFEYFSSLPGNRPPKYLSSHPPDKEHIAKARQRAEYLAQRNPSDILSESHIVHRDGKVYVAAGWVDGVTADTTIVVESLGGRTFRVERKSIRFSETQVRAKTHELPEGTVVRFAPPLRGYHDEPAAIGSVTAVQPSSNTITVDLGRWHKLTPGLVYDILTWRFEEEMDDSGKTVKGRVAKPLATARVKEVRERECVMELTDFEPKPDSASGEKFSAHDILIGDEVRRSGWMED